MLRIGIVTASTIVSAFLIISGMTVGSATAQTAANGTPGQPIQLLPIARQRQAAAQPAAKSVAQSSIRSGIALRRKTKSHVSVANARARHHAALQLADADPVSHSASPTPPTAAPADVPTIAAAASQPETAPPERAPPGAAIVDDYAAQVSAPQAVNESNLAASDADVPVNATSPTVAAAKAPSMRDIADVTPKSDSTNVAVGRRQSGEVGSVSWILQVLAALGGAVTVGSVAWFLIGPSPQGTYGRAFTLSP
jgi:hypothetical protein